MAKNNTGVDIFNAVFGITYDDSARQQFIAQLYRKYRVKGVYAGPLCELDEGEAGWTLPWNILAVHPRAARGIGSLVGKALRRERVAVSLATNTPLIGAQRGTQSMVVVRHHGLHAVQLCFGSASGETAEPEYAMVTDQSSGPGDQDTVLATYTTRSISFGLFGLTETDGTASRMGLPLREVTRQPALTYQNNLSIYRPQISSGAQSDGNTWPLFGQE